MNNLEKYSATKPLREYQTAITVVQTSMSCVCENLPGELTLNQLRILMEVICAEANQEFLEMRDLVVRLGLSRGAVSRYVGTLSSRGYGNKPGLGLLDQSEDKKDRRVKRLTLTERGVAVGMHLGEVAKQSVLRHKVQLVEFIQEKSGLVSVSAGIDSAANLAVYKVRGQYDSRLYRQMVQKMLACDDYHLFFDEVIDLSDAVAIEQSDSAVDLTIEWIQMSPYAARKRTFFVANDEAVLAELRRIESRFREAGLETLVVCTSLDDLKTKIKLHGGWELPNLTPLILV